MDAGFVGNVSSVPGELGGSLTSVPGGCNLVLPEEHRRACPFVPLATVTAALELCNTDGILSTSC